MKPKKPEEIEKLTKRDIVLLNEALHSVAKLQGVKFAYAVAKNDAIIKPELEACAKASEQSDEFKKYEELRFELVEKYGKRDENNKLVVVDNAYVIADQLAFDKEFKALKEAHKEVIEKRDAQLKEYNLFLDEPSDVSLFQVSIESVPETISVEQMVGIAKIIAE